jgi:hypothetical protein
LGKRKGKDIIAFSGLHFGHYKAAAESDMLSEIHAMMTEMAMKGGFAYSRWKEGLSVMIPKITGACTVNRLQAILLFKGDFNWANTLLFADRMFKRAQREGVIPQEQYAQH